MKERESGVGARVEAERQPPLLEQQHCSSLKERPGWQRLACSDTDELAGLKKREPL